MSLTTEQQTLLDRFSWLTFDPTHHIHYDEDRRMMQGVTSLIQRFKKPFDEISHARKLAAQQGRTLEEVLTENQLRYKGNLNLGSLVHKGIEIILSGGGQVSLDQVMSEVASTTAAPLDPQLGGIRNPLRAFIKFHDQRLLARGAEILATELHIGNRQFSVAGIVDCLARIDGKINLFEWKTGRAFRDDLSTRYKMLHPYTHLADCELVRYSLQAQLYAGILRRARVPVARAEIIWLTDLGDYQIYPALPISHEWGKYFGDKWRHLENDHATEETAQYTTPNNGEGSGTRVNQSNGGEDGQPTYQ